MSGTTVTGQQLNRRIRLEQPSFTSDGAGGGVAGWSVVADRVPAKIEYPPPSRKGDETYSQHQVHTQLFVSVTIRHRPSTNIGNAMRIVYGTRIFAIRTVVPINEERRYIMMQCEEIFAQGTLH